VEAFSCGFSHGLLTQLDWIALVELVDGVAPASKAADIILCVKNAIPIGGRREDNPDFNRILFKCIVGIDIGDLADQIKGFVVENWDEPYYQGEASAFVITLLSPYKAQLLQKLKKITNYASKITKLETLAKARTAEELVEASRGLTRKASAESGVGVARGGARFAGFKNISKLPDNILSKIEAKGWTDDVLTKLDADLADDAFKLKLTSNVDVVDAWGILRNTPYKTNSRYLDYVNSLKNEAKFGTSVRKDYRKTFFEAFPELTETDYVIHHAIEQQALMNFPGVITEAEMHSLQNLRGIPKTINSDVHLRRIRSEWDDFYLDNPNPTKQQLLQKAKEIDDLLGNHFYPPVR
jgi:hypothetical protein